MGDSSLQKIVIIGAGGFGRETCDVLQEIQNQHNRWELLGFLDDDSKQSEEEYAGYRVLGPIDWLKRQDNPEKISVIIAVGNNELRKRIAEKIKKIGCIFASLIHPDVRIAHNVNIGEGVIITAGCILTNRIKIGNHVIINLDVTIGHDVTIEDFVNINPGVHINGSNYISQGAYIGTGVVTIQNVRIGQWSVIGAGAVVVKDIPEKVLAVGIPAEVKKGLKSKL